MPPEMQQRIVVSFHFRLILLIGSGRPRVTNKVQLLTLCYSVGEPRYSQAQAIKHYSRHYELSRFISKEQS